MEDANYVTDREDAKLRAQELRRRAGLIPVPDVTETGFGGQRRKIKTE